MTSAVNASPLVFGKSTSNHKFTSSNRKNSHLEMDESYDVVDKKLQRNNSECRLRLNEDDSISSICSDQNDNSTIPTEVRKTIMCFVLMLIVLVGNLLCSTVVHVRTPMRLDNSSLAYPPLRDIAFDVSGSFIQVDKFLLLTICELILLSSSAFVILLLCLHKNKSILFRRFFFLIALLFSARLLTMNVTMLPISSEALYKCYSKSDLLTGGLLLDRLTQLLATCGVANIRFCGNYVYSGHAVLLILNCLFVDEYYRLYLLNLSFQLMSAVGVLLILVSEFDYTISVITAYYVSTRIFWIYHTLAIDMSLKNLKEYNVNQICKEWWYPIFKYLEGNIHSVILPMNHSIR